MSQENGKPMAVELDPLEMVQRQLLIIRDASETALLLLQMVRAKGLDPDEAKDVDELEDLIREKGPKVFSRADDTPEPEPVE